MRAKKLGVHAPSILHVDTQENCIFMEHIQGILIKDVLLQGTHSREGVPRWPWLLSLASSHPFPSTAVNKMLADIGKAIALLHDGGLVHGDLTTSNMMFRPNDGVVVMLDFGLAYNTILAEDKAVDLYVLERAFTSLHSQQEGLFDLVFESYKRHSKQWSATLNRLGMVRMRGRKRVMVG